MSGRVDDRLPIGKEIAASRPAVACTNHLGIAAVESHRVNLVAWNSFATCLEDQLFTVERIVGFCILATKGELTQISQTHLLHFGYSQRRRIGYISFWGITTAPGRSHYQQPDNTTRPRDAFPH